MFCKLWQFSNAESPILDKLCDRTMFCNDVQFLNAFELIRPTVFGMLIIVKFSHCLKAELPIVINWPGKIRFCKFRWFSNAESPMFVIVIPFMIVGIFISFFSLNHVPVIVSPVWFVLKAIKQIES